MSTARDARIAWINERVHAVVLIDADGKVSAAYNTITAKEAATTLREVADDWNPPAGEDRLLPVAAYAIAAKIEDRLRVWNRRPENAFLPQTVTAAGTAVTLLDDLIATLGSFRDAVEAELGKYVAPANTPETEGA